MLSSEIGLVSWGSSGFTMTRDGVTKQWRMTWLEPWAYWEIAVVEHEMGHGFGLPHSSGNYGQTYCNQWDVMSNLSKNCANSYDATYHCLGQHTIADSKFHVGWTNSSLITNVTQWNYTIERLAQPQTAEWRLVAIAIGSTSPPITHYYTIEARRRVGYDVKLPGEGIIIHEVDTTRAIPAHVIDIDNNGNTGDEGAIWRPGEVFADVANNIYVCVNSETATGYTVTVGRGVRPAVDVVCERQFLVQIYRHQIRAFWRQRQVCGQNVHRWCDVQYYKLWRPESRRAQTMLVHRRNAHTHSNACD